MGIVQRKETNINKNTHRVPFSKKETRSLLSKQIHKWDQGEGEGEGGIEIIETQ